MRTRNAHAAAAAGLVLLMVVGLAGCGKAGRVEDSAQAAPTTPDAQGTAGQAVTGQVGDDPGTDEPAPGASSDTGGGQGEQPPEDTGPWPVVIDALTAQKTLGRYCGGGDPYLAVAARISVPRGPVQIRYRVMVGDNEAAETHTFTGTGSQRVEITPEPWRVAWNGEYDVRLEIQVLDAPGMLPAQRFVAPEPSATAFTFTMPVCTKPAISIHDTYAAPIVMPKCGQPGTGQVLAGAKFTLQSPLSPDDGTIWVEYRWERPGAAATEWKERQFNPAISLTLEETHVFSHFAPSAGDVTLRIRVPNPGANPHYYLGPEVPFVIPCRP